MIEVHFYAGLCVPLSRSCMLTPSLIDRWSHCSQKHVSVDNDVPRVVRRGQTSFVLV